MNTTSLEQARMAAKAFLERIEAHKIRLMDDTDYARMWTITGYQQTAAIRRASMELTRALARLRRAGK